MKRSILTVIGLACAVVGVAQPLQYAQASIEVRAGVLVIPGQIIGGVAANPAPHVWGNLDQDANVKPAKWTFVNPVGSSVLTTGVRNRWSVLDPSTPAVGSRLTKNTSPYWEVPLDTIDDKTLASYDVLTLTINRNMAVNAAERDKLRRYIDQGGVLWVDLVNDTGAAISLDLVNPLPLPFTWATDNRPVDANLFHPITQFPNPMSLNDIALTDYPLPVNAPIVTGPLAANALGSLDNTQTWIAPDSQAFQGVAGTVTDANTISVGKIGQGFFVLTSRGVTSNLSRGIDVANPTGYSVNRGYYGLAVPNDAPFVSAAKFAINVVSLGGLSTTRGTGSRHTNSNSVDLTAPLLRRFRDDQGGQILAGQQPALYKGRVIVSRGDRVFVYDARPDSDLDGDGDPDDGLANPTDSFSDLVWVSPSVGSKVSPPTVIESGRTVLSNPNRGGVLATEQVWVSDEQSRIWVFDLNTDGVTNQAVLASWPPLPGTPVAPPTAASPTADGPFAPTVHESLVFVTDGANGPLGDTGRVWTIDLATAQRVATANDFAIYQSSRMPLPSAAATVGYVPIQDGSGGLDRVVYMPCAPSSGITPRPASLASVWLGARAESPIRREYDGTSGTMTLTTRASYNGLPILTGPANALKSLGIKITLVQQNGDPLNTVATQNILGSASVSEPSRGTLLLSGVVNAGGFDLDGQQTPGNPNDDLGWRLDYTVDWGQAGSGGFNPSYENYVRGNLELPDDSRNTRVIVGSPALTANGNLYVATSFPKGSSDTGATLFVLREDRSPGNFSMRGRFELYDRLTFNLNSSNGANDLINMPPVLTDQDELVNLLPFLNAEMNTWHIVGGPAVRNDTVYVTAEARKPIFGNVPTAIVMAFKADMGAMSFEIEGQDSNFTLVQPDPALSLNKAQPEQYSVLQAGQFTVEPVPNTTRSRVVLNSLMNVTRGRVRDSINASLPVIIRRGGQTDTVIEPEALADNGRLIAGRSGGRFNPLQWYLVFNGYQPETSPIVAGQTLYMAGSSVLPSLIVGSGFQPKGLLFAMDANVSPNDEFLRPNTLRPWTVQMTTFIGANFNSVRVANAIRWPQFKGITDGDDLRIRILQASVEDSTIREIAAGDETLAASSDESLYAFSRSDFLVVDAGRVGRFDPAGNPIWNTDQTLQSGRNTPTSAGNNARALSEPHRIYPAGGNGYWIVDTGNNRVVRVDGAGREVRTIESLRLDPRYAPDGVNDQGAPSGGTAAMSLKFKRPKDVLVWETFVDGTVPGRNPFSNPRPLERWVHTLIADSGNSRIVELVDRYEINPANGRNLGVVQYEDPPASGTFVQAFGVLNWHSPEELSGKDYSYNSIARTVNVDAGGVRHTVVGFGFGNVEPGTAALGLDSTGQNVDRSSGTGGIVLYDGRDSTVIREFTRPPVLANSYLAENPPGSGSFSFSTPTTDQAARTQKFVGLTSVTLRYVDVLGTRQLAVMFSDATGVYEIIQDLSQANQPWVVRWMLPLEAYVGIRRPRGGGPYSLGQLGDNPRGFRPMYAKRLDSGEVLIVNGHVGRRFDNTPFEGEVVLVDGSFADASTLTEDPGFSMNRPNLGFTRLAIKFELPPVQGTRGIVSPVFAYRQ